MSHQSKSRLPFDPKSDCDPGRSTLLRGPARADLALAPSGCMFTLTRMLAGEKRGCETFLLAITATLINYNQ